MKIGFDAKRAAQNRTGLGNYSRFILRLLSQVDSTDELHLYIPKEHRTPYLKEIPTLDKLHLHFPQTTLWRRLASIWRVWGITRDLQQDGIQLFHGLSNELPLTIRRASLRSIVTIHDVIFLHTPQYYKLIDCLIYNYKFRRACEMADCVIAVSEFTKQEIIRYYHTPAEKIRVVYQGCDPAFSRPVDAETLQQVKQRYQLPDKFLLYVGSIEERKNLLLVAKALVELKEQMPEELFHVVALGKHTPYVDVIKDFLKTHQIEAQFHFFHNANYLDFPAIYRLSRAFVYPSRIEGFGIPLLEAISSGVPTIGCTGSCLEEAGGPDSLYVHPDDAKGLAQAIAKVWYDEALRQHMIEKGLQYAQNFTDEALGRELLKVYREVMA